MFGFQKLALVGALLFSGFSARAGIMIEPYLGYETGSQLAPATNSIGDNSGQISGMNYGARIGYMAPMLFWVALDGTAGSSKFKAGNTGTNVNFGTNMDADVSRTVAGLTVGVNLPILLRVWAGYNFMDNFQNKLSSTSATDKYEGTSYKAGVGLKLIPFLSLNLEVIQRAYTKASGDSYTGSTTLTSSTRFSKLEQSSVLVSVSLPL